MNLHRILRSLSPLMFILTAWLAWAERPCSRLPHPWGDFPEDIICTVTNYWTLEVDLDGDGKADLTRERFRAENRYTGYDEAGQFAGSYLQQDEIEAYYPTAGTEIYVRLDPRAVFPWDPRVPAGQWIQPDPEAPVFPYWTWMTYSAENPVFEAEGLGIIRRYTDRYPCEAINCMREDHTGWMRGPEAWPFQGEYYFGVRLLKADGWHLGWIHLLWQYDIVDRLGPVKLVSSAIHPEPGMPIRAGQPAQPTLRAQRDGDTVVVSWAAVWEGFALERSAMINGDTWTAVPGVSGNTVRLPAAEAPAFLRLRQSP